jgi:serine/threonine protein kinase/tetratricopeptide (TPR) repeat protein
MLGQTLGQYLVLEQIGAGGMGVVYRAHDLRLDRDVALKVLPVHTLSDATARARLLREARLASKLNHPHICTIFGVGEADPSTPSTGSGDASSSQASSGQAVFFIAMELVEGQSLSVRLAGGALPIEEVLRYGLQVADALAHAHERGVVHRDLKCGNVVITPEGRAKVLDFGLARRIDEYELDGATRSQFTLTAPGMIMGTLAYMSPEQLRGQPADARSDVWALGVMLHEMAAGQRPFQGHTSFELSSAILRETPQPLPGQVPPALRAVVSKCLAREPRERYRTAGELRAALEAAHATPGFSHASTPATPAKRSVAVLPFVNLSADPENEFFADGITEDVIAQLSKMRALKVISRTSAMQFKKREQAPREIAAKLGVATLVEGSVRKAGNRVRIVAQLVDAATDEQLWAETYDRQLTDIFEIQSHVALSIAEALQTELSPTERARIEAPAATVNIEAYQLYLQGRQCLRRYTEAEMQRALELLNRAIALEPRYSAPHAEVAWVHIIRALGHGAGAARPRDSYARAREAVARALELDPLNGEAHGTLGSLKFMADYDWVGADESFRRGLELKPGDFFMLDAYGLMLSAQERYDEALAVQRRARELDPLAAVATSDLTTTLIRAGRYDEAVGEARRLNEMDPAFPLAHSTLGWALVMKGESAEGLRELEQAVSLSPGNTLFLAQLGEAYGLTGDTSRTREVLARLHGMAETRFVTPYHFAYVYTGLGEFEKAIDLLAVAVEERAGGAYGIKGSFLFMPLRTHPRFLALLRKINLAADS